MDNFDKKIRRFLVDEGYLFPSTDAEIERSILEAQAQGIEIPKHLDDPKFFLGINIQHPQKYFKAKTAFLNHRARFFNFNKKN